MGTHDDILRKIRALLAKADSTDFPGEADVFRQKAEELMARYRIERAMLGESHTDNMIRDEMYDMGWYSGPHGSDLWSLMFEVAAHCEVKLVAWQFSWSSYTIPLVGTDADREWFNGLFTSVMLEFMKGLEPQPDPNKSLIENLVMLKEAGQKWLRIAEQLRAIHQLRASQFTTWEEFKDDEEAKGVVFVSHSEWEAKVRKQVHHLNFSGKYTNYCREHNRQRLRVTPAIYQRSFASGFISRMYERLAELRRHAKSTLTEQESTGLELVLTSNRERANHYAIEKFGPPPQYRGSAGRRRTRTLQYDSDAMNAGEQAANRVDLQNAKGVGTGRGALPRG